MFETKLTMFVIVAAFIYTLQKLYIESLHTKNHFMKRIKDLEKQCKSRKSDTSICPDTVETITGTADTASIADNATENLNTVEVDRRANEK